MRHGELGMGRGAAEWFARLGRSDRSRWDFTDALSCGEDVDHGLQTPLTSGVVLVVVEQRVGVGAFSAGPSLVHDPEQIC